ncbi:hypothetical protein [Roseovarius sp. 2305UL8-3]|uniref:hypothetical protein n=1 Tax=Roseovarius conchicola TaxID=3121636 RepID=UPI0035273431
MKAVFAALMLASPVAAQQAVPCDWAARADGIVEPWEDHTATFANGEVRLALLDTIEPAAGAFRILILSPPYDELGGRQCATLGLSGQTGFSGADFSSLVAHYDAQVGLVFQMNVTRFDGVEFAPEILVFTLNQATGDIAAQLQ